MLTSDMSFNTTYINFKQFQNWYLGNTWKRQFDKLITKIPLWSPKNFEYSSNKMFLLKTWMLNVIQLNVTVIIFCITCLFNLLYCFMISNTFKLTFSFWNDIHLSPSNFTVFSKVIVDFKWQIYSYMHNANMCYILMLKFKVIINGFTYQHVLLLRIILKKYL